MGSARLKQLRDALVRKPQHPTRLAHRQMRAVNQVGRYLSAGGRLTLQDLSFIAHLPDPSNLLFKVAASDGYRLSDPEPASADGAKA